MSNDDYKSALAFQEDLVGLIASPNAFNDVYYQEKRTFFIQRYPDNVPIFLKNCRTLESFINQLMNIAYGAGSWKKRREFIYNEFKEFLNFLEFGEISRYDEANIKNGSIYIVLQKEVFSHVKELLISGHYFNAIEESYKIVRKKLKDITGKERAHEAFSENNYLSIFGRVAEDEPEKDFFEGVKFLHMAIQKLRNEKAHTPANEIDKNLAIHYIVLASLAYDLIDRR
ncbi:TIGR02391 family protein [Patescibacteria group bacterium]